MTSAGPRDPELEKLGLYEVLNRWSPTLRDLRISPLTPDASLRSYYRVHARATAVVPPSVLAMVFHSLAVPESTGKVSVNSFDAYVELTKFLRRNGIAVPAIYFESTAPHVLLIEDFGDTLLADVLLATERDEPLIAKLYREAIAISRRIQAIPQERNFFAYQRSFTPEVYSNEMYETRDFVLRPLRVASSRLALFDDAVRTISEELKHFPEVLAHRDFHSWNLMVDETQHVRVIDFQDALLATGSYDVVGLLNDRDTDSALGDDLYRSLVLEFRDLGKAGGDFFSEYNRTLLQRDLKVAGRFAKLSTVRGLKQYERWIPGTLRRIGRTLERMVRSRGERPIFTSLLEVLEESLPDVRRGIEEPLDFHESPSGNKSDV